MFRRLTLAGIPGRLTLSGVLVGACAITLALALPELASADTMSLSISPEPTEEVTAQIDFATNSAEDTYSTVVVNNPGIPCAPKPGADNGHIIYDPGDIPKLVAQAGEYSGSANYTFPSTGAYTVCGWVTSPEGLGFPGGPVTASTSLALNVRLPAISLSLRFPRPAQVDKKFTLTLVASSEVKREVVVEGVPYTKRGCPVNYAASNEAHLIDTEVNGGPTTTNVNIEPLRAGKYLFCAWADPYEDNGLNPEATTSVLLNLTGHPLAKAHKRKVKEKRHRKKAAKSHHRGKSRR